MGAYDRPYARSPGVYAKESVNEQVRGEWAAAHPRAKSTRTSKDYAFVSVPVIIAEKGGDNPAAILFRGWDRHSGWR